MSVIEDHVDDMEGVYAEITSSYMEIVVSHRA